MKRHLSTACLAIATAVVFALLTSTMVFAEGEIPEEPVDDPSTSEVIEDEITDPAGEDQSDPELEPSEEETTGVSASESADSGSPQESQPEENADEPEESTSSQDEETASDNEVQEEDIESSEGSTADDATDETDPSDEEGAASEESETDVDETQGDETIVLSDENGDPLDMASQDSADAIANGDPWWMVGTTKYSVVFSEGDCPAGTLNDTCFVSDKPIEYALSLIDDNGWVPSDGKLYVEAGTYTDNVVIDGSSGNGYLSGLKGLIGAGSGSVTLTGSITISNTLLGFTLSGFSINGSVTVDSNTGNLNLEDLYIQNDSGDGLIVSNHNGNVTLTNVQSRDNKGDGARIDNTAGTKRSVTITNSSFDYNDDEDDLTWNVGLWINTSGAVILEGVATSRNNGNGTEIYGFSALTINNSLFDHNYADPFSATTPYGYGLLASTTNSAYVRIENVFAYYNDNTAIDIETAGSVYLSYVRASHSSIRVGEIDSSGETVYERLNEDNKNTGDRWYFSGSNGQELEILLESDAFDTYLGLYDASDDSELASNDDIDGTTTNSQINYTLSADGLYYIIVKTLESSESTDGDYTLSLNDPSHTNETEFDIPGLKIDTTAGTGTIYITSGMFQDNIGDGMDLDSLRTITLYSIDASYNSHNGASLDTCQYDEILGICTGSGPITLDSSKTAGWYGANYFLGNSGTGLFIRSGSTIKLTNTSAYDNLGNGLEIDNPYSSGTIIIRVTLDNFSNVFRNNGGSGVKINSAGKIMIYDTEADSNGQNGFELTSGSTISLYIITASDNGEDGLLVDNSGSNGSVYIKNKVEGSQPEFSNNGDNGIEIITQGTISIYNVVANDNGGSGAILDTYVSDSGSGSIILNTYYYQVNTFDGNTDYGMYVTSSGNITFQYVSASENGETGLYVDNPLTYGTVMIKNPIRTGTGEFSYNGVDGINISTRGHIFLYNVSASSNASSGMVLDNCQLSGGECLGSGKIAMSGLYSQINSFNNNHDYGVYIQSGGSVSLINIEANQNGYYGLYVNNKLELAIQSVTISATKGVTNSFNYNGSLSPSNYPGLVIHSYGNIYLNSVEASNNYAAGAYLTNADATISPSYIRIYDGTFNENQGSGLLAYSKGKVFLYGITASYNSLTYFDIVMEGESVYERLTAISSYDTWWFEIPSEPTLTDFTIILESLEFDALLEIYDADGNLLASDDNSYSDYDAEIIISLTEPGTYFIRVLAADGNHGNYTLSINDETHTYKTYFNYYGALIDNSAGSDIVIINKGKTVLYNEFNDNNYRGIEVITNNAITAYNLLASDNGDTGAYLSNKDGKGNITIKMLSKGELGEFDSNSEWGLYAASLGSIYLTNISASSNGSAGALLNNCIYDSGSGLCLGKGNVYIQSSGAVNDFSNNQLYGLYIASSGNVLIYDITADGNGYNGLYVKNQYPLIYGSVTIRSGKTNTNSFSGNGWKNPLNSYGIEVYSNGIINMYGGYVIGNYGGGALLFNQNSDLVRNVYLYDTSFEANQGDGLWVKSKGSIYLYGVQSRYNSVNSGEIDLLGETIYEHLTPYYAADTWWFSGYTDDPVEIILESDEFDVFLEVFDQDGNLLYSDDDSYGGTDATLSFTLPANGNYYVRVSTNNEETGNYILSLNDAAEEYTTAYVFSGAVLDNSYGNGNVLITTTNFNKEPNFYHNNWDGLEIDTAGNVNLYNLSAMQNGEDGIDIDATYGNGRIYVYNTSRKNTTSYSYNTKFGLYVLANGHVSVINNGRMFLRDNGYSGAYIDNSTGVGAYVIVQSAELNQNGWKGVTGKGLEIYSSGNVTIRTVLAINNVQNGVFIDNTTGSGFVNITGPRGENTISDNGATGLAVYSNGSIFADKIIAIQNGGRGMILDNSGGIGAGITFTNSIARLNARHGLQIYTDGAVLMKKVQSMSNGEGYDGDGLNIEITDPTLLKIYNSTFIGNEGNGIELISDSFSSMPLLFSVSYFGNDTDMDGELNYYAHTP